MIDSRKVNEEAIHLTIIRCIQTLITEQGKENILSSQSSRLTARYEALIDVLQSLDASGDIHSSHDIVMAAIFSDLVKNVYDLAQMVHVLSHCEKLETFVTRLVEYAIITEVISDTKSAYEFLIHFIDVRSHELQRRMAAILFGPAYLSKFICEQDQMDDYLSRLTEAFPFIDIILLLEMQEFIMTAVNFAYTENSHYISRYLNLIEESVNSAINEMTLGCRDTFYLLSQYTAWCLTQVGPEHASYDPEDEFYQKLLAFHYQLLQKSTVLSLQDICKQYIRTSGFFSRHNTRREEYLTHLPPDLLDEVLLVPSNWEDVAVDKMDCSDQTVKSYKDILNPQPTVNRFR